MKHFCCFNVHDSIEVMWFLGLFHIFISASPPHHQRERLALHFHGFTIIKIIMHLY